MTKTSSIKIQLDSDKILEILNKFKPLTSSNSIYDIDSFTLIDIKKDSIIISKTNNDIYLRETIPSNNIEEVKLLINSEFIFNAIAAYGYNGEYIVKDYKLTVKNKIGKVSIPIENYIKANTEPSIPENTKSIKIPTNMFISGISKTNKFTTQGGNFDPFSGILIKQTDTFDIVALDYIIMSLFTINENFGDNIEFIIPLNIAIGLTKILEENTEVEFFHAKNRTFFKSKNIYGSFVNIEGAFRNYRSIIPDLSYMNVVKVNRKSLIKAIKQVEPFIDKTYNLIEISFNKDKMFIIAENKDFRKKAFIYIPILSEPINGKIGLDINKFKNILSSSQSETIDIFFSDKKGNIVVKSELDNEFFLQSPRGI